MLCVVDNYVSGGGAHDKKRGSVFVMCNFPRTLF